MSLTPLSIKEPLYYTIYQITFFYLVRFKILIFFYYICINKSKNILSFLEKERGCASLALPLSLRLGATIKLILDL